MTSRKERRIKAAIRAERGLPPARPWDHVKQQKTVQIHKLQAIQDEQLAARLGVSVELVQQIRKSATTPPIVVNTVVE
jgi:hypothetical protein